MRLMKPISLSLVLGVLFCSVFLLEKASASSVFDFNEVTVIGSKEAQNEIPGSGHYVDNVDIQSRNIDDIHEALRQVPGTYLREEDGYGLFPNISLRGVDPARSGKITVMEDGVLTAPAPYSAPSAYYTPTAGRMNGIEVLKGTSQIKYGPHTTGGVLNYISTPVPDEYKVYVKVLYGTDNEVRLHTYIGDTLEFEAGSFGYLVEEYYREADGFKTIDSAPDFSNTDQTGFENSEPMLKLFWEPNSDRYQKLEWKIGYTDRDADETYLGLSEADFKADPFRRYNSTRFDNINTKQTRTYLQYQLETTDDTFLTLTGYYNKFNRDWFKLHDLRANSGGALPSAQRSLSVALLNNLAVLRGEEAGIFRVRHNRRDYEGYGVQGVLDWNFETGEIEHNVEFGTRYHMDYVRRRQRNVDYTQNATGLITGINEMPDGAAGNRRQETDALAFFIADEMVWGDLTITSGYRHEELDYYFEDLGTGLNVDQVTRSGEASPNVWAAGVGATYDVNENWQVLGGIHRGYSVPGPRSNITGDIQEETSVSVEGGVRYNNQNHFSIEAIYFQTDFSDLIVADNVGGSGSGITENAGDVDSMGVELLIEFDPGLANEIGFSIPNRFTFTWTNAELDGDANSTDPESIFSGGVDGNEVPYIPEVQFQFTTGVEFETWNLLFDFTYVDETFTTGNNVDNLIRPDGVMDARFGKTDEQFTIDISSQIELKENLDFVVTLQNILDEEYIVSRHPHGPRPGRPFAALFGIESEF